VKFLPNRPLRPLLTTLVRNDPTENDRPSADHIDELALPGSPPPRLDHWPAAAVGRPEDGQFQKAAARPAGRSWPPVVLYEAAHARPEKPLFVVGVVGFWKPTSCPEGA